MLRLKLFILLYLAYTATAQYRRTPLRQLQDSQSPTPQLSSGNVTETQSNTTAEATTVVSFSKSDQTTTEDGKKELFKKPNVPPTKTFVNQRKPPQRLQPRTALLSPYKLAEARRANTYYENASSTEQNVLITTSPKPEGEFEKLVPEVKSEIESPIQSNPDISIFQPRSSFSDPKTELEPESVAENPSTTTLSPEADVKCTVKNAYYAIPYACNIFIECQNFVYKKRVCPDGLLFNTKAFWPRYPCSYPSDVECSNNTITQISNSTDECPRRFGTFASKEGDCGKYIVCEDGRPLHMNCPIGLAFNPKVAGCDWPENVPNCYPKVFQNFTCPITSTDDSHKIYNYGYNNSCKEYVACVKGVPRLLRCDSGLSFDEITSHCIDSDAVLKCKIVSQIVDTKLYIKKV